jgi:N-acetylglucosaminyldiphosphoundecaprenol N-acetyl-beta-D-mannosaminyltransferase
MNANHALTSISSCANAFAATYKIPLVSIGGLPIAVTDCKSSAEVMLQAARSARAAGTQPLVITSANGQVLSLCARSKEIRQLFLSADLIHADGMPLVLASRLKGRTPLPERVATTDLFHDAARAAEEKGASFFFLGATQDIIERATAKVRALYPRLTIAGCRNGYIDTGEEDEVVNEINARGADILWIGMGAPYELAFSLRNRARLGNFGLIKTSGGLFDFLSGKNRRAPKWMQAAGLEWLYRLALEPRRLAGRYASTNFHAAYLLLSESNHLVSSHPTARAEATDTR